ncbi:DUF4339 domain-containing protein [Amphiplicatus metriothermophilus]|uniref:GYF domain-containing protein n=1 Tax=Amphiplicatus metriothermophilus TaxID=1519374 RepID=A0A239PPT7_9PROT|nr:DUF4339 domain-containing protein [Amphiplicatus metriothermophilus]MBB5518792.1 hypothetical protein [Amphiplicatus metriothermophilus]SNT72053.1 hypothetical protein SAMN06297382_1079 [Amphiplicatus metriothermophilus]
MVAIESWCVKVAERVYGPYTTQQLRRFARQGRFAARSLVAPAGSRSWREARHEPAFAALFDEGTGGPSGDVNRCFGKRVSPAAKREPDGREPPARLATRLPPTLTPRGAVADDGAMANFVIVFDVVSAAASRVEPAILSLGPAFRIADNVWTVCCELTAVGVRNAIAPYLLPREPIFVVDATRGRTAWQNYTPELHAKLAAAWLGQPEAARLAG